MKQRNKREFPDDLKRIFREIDSLKEYFKDENKKELRKESLWEKK